MAIQSKNLSLEEFLGATAGSRDSGLLIAKDSDELCNFTQSLDEMGFQPLSSIFDYVNSEHGWYMVISDLEHFKPIYDFICQYSLTVISLYNPEQFKMITIKLNYQHGVVFALTNEVLAKAQKTGFDILGRVGPAYRTE